MTLTAEHARAVERCLEDGGVAILPTDTVYGLACDPGDEDAVDRLYALKGRDAGKPAAVLFFALDDALAAVAEAGARTRAALEALLPGPVTAIVRNPAGRFPLACGPDPTTLGVRVPALGPPIAALGTVRRPILQSSANLSGGPDPRRASDVEESLRAGADLVLDAGELPGTASTVVDLRELEGDGRWRILREGALPAAAVAAALRS